MTRKITLLLLAFVGMFSLANAQRCGFDVKHQQQLATNPLFAQQVQQMNTQIANMIQSNPNALVVNTSNGPVYQIPVVVHVIHTGGAVGTVYNPTDAQLISMIDYLNKSYSATWPAYPSATTGGTFIPLQFVLAKRTPTCTATTGITRDNGSSVPNYTANGVSLDFGVDPGADEVLVKAVNRWPNTQYYNIWIVNKINGEDGVSPTSSYVAGYAYFPGAAANIDGTVMLATQATAGQITLTHEVGHAFSLYHTFQGDNGGTTCPANANCATDGDLVCDTDPHMQTQFNCPTGTNPCTGNPFGTVVHNFMDYSNCQDRFTPGQKTRVMAAIVASGRGSLISSLGGTAISGAVTAACIPTAGSTITGSNAGPRTIKVTDGTYTYMNVTSSGYSGDGNLVYVDNTCKHELDVTAGQIYNFSVTTGFNPEKVRIYVDYNNDGTFQANELIYTHDGTSNNETHSFQYAVPTTSTIPGLVSCVPLRMRVVSDRSIVSSVTDCGQIGYGQAEDYSIMIRGGGPSTGAVTVSLTSGTNPSCFNSPLTFTAVPSTGITSPTYLWYVNNISTGITTNTYSSSTLVNGDIVTVKMYFVGACGNDSSVSTNYVVQRAASVPASVSIALTTGNNPGCANQSLTFTATPQNGGTAPTYTWKVNGNPQGTNSPTFTSVLNNNDIVTVDMVSNSSCASPATATSNAITITHNTITADVSIALVSGSIPACSGKPLMFEATVLNGGTSPQYQWLVNGTAIAGATNATYTTSTLANNDVVKAVFIATDACVSNATDTSNGITAIINPTLTPIVTVAITKGSNPGCLDSLVEFTATVTNHGSNPNSYWYVNGSQVGTGTVFSSNSLLNGDVVLFRSAANDGGCYTSDTVDATPITMSLFSTPAAPVISLIGNMLVASVNTTLQWFGPSGLIPGATSQNYHPTVPGLYYAVVNNGGCYSLPSNKLLVSLMNVGEYNLDQVKIFPNPTDGKITLDWGNQTASVKLDIYNITGQGLLHEDVKNQSRKTIDLSHFTNGNYFIVITDEKGKMGTVKITVAK